jgi:hypothetical protein
VTRQLSKIRLRTAWRCHKVVIESASNQYQLRVGTSVWLV